MGSEADEAEVVRSTVARISTHVNGRDLDVQRLTGGASRSTWLVRPMGQAGSVDGERAFVVQRQRRGLGRDMALEAAALGAAAEAGVKVPPLVGYVVAADGTPTLVTEQVAGETIARRILRDDRFAHARGTLVADLGTAAARLHQIRLHHSTVGELSGAPVVSDPVAEYRRRLDEVGEPHPTFELVFRWLDEHRPPLRPPAVVHGDLRLGNVIVDEDGLAAVIDWELVHIGDPVEDLGWLCVAAWRFGESAPVAGLGTREQLLEAYGAAGGVEVTADELHWWEVFGTLKWGVITVTQAHAHLSGASRNHELASIGRRTCETELDLFVALKGRW